mgnify:CR=1 FL=1
MKKLFSIMAMLVLNTGMLLAEEGQKTAGTFLVVRVSDYAGTDSVQVMTPEEFKALDTTIKEEARFTDKAIAEAEKEWKKDETRKGKSFPKGGIKDRKAEKLGTFNDREKASKRADSFTKDGPDPEKKKASTKTPEQVKEEAAKKANREALLAEGRGMFESKLQEVMAASKKEGGEAKKDGGGEAKK